MFKETVYSLVRSPAVRTCRESVFLLSAMDHSQMCCQRKCFGVAKKTSYLHSLAVHDKVSICDSARQKNEKKTGAQNHGKSMRLFFKRVLVGLFVAAVKCDH